MNQQGCAVLKRGVLLSTVSAAALWAMPAQAIEGMEQAPLTGAVTASAPADAPPPSDAPSSSEEEKEDPDAIIVTGTLIRGIEPAGANVIGVDKEQIESIGASSTTDVLKRIPQATQFMGIDQPLASAQFQQINKVNLRNLDTLITSTNNTLLLLDGHRMVNSGINQNVPDPDIVPPGVIERVEVLPDGGSATYGTDAIGGVINFITRRRFSGIKADVRYGFAEDYHTLEANVAAGHDWGSGSAWVAYAYAETGSIFGIDREWVRKFGLNNTMNPDLTCTPANVIIRRGTVQTTYAVPGLLPNTVNGCDVSDDQTIFPPSKRHSVMAAINQDLTDNITLDMRGYFTRRETLFSSTPTSNVTINGPGAVSPVTGASIANPFYRRTADNPAPQAPLTQTVSFDWSPVLGRRSTLSSASVLKSWGITPTLTVDLGSSWQVRLMANHGWSESLAWNEGINPTALTAAVTSTNPTTAINPYDLAATNPTVIANITNYGGYALGKQSMANYRAIGDGTLFMLPGGEMRLAVGVEYLRETFKGKQQNLADPLNAGPQLPFKPEAKRNNKSVFAELAIPIVGDGNRFGGVHSLDLSLSGRYDHYSDFGGTFNPKIAATYSPVDWVKIRGNWGTSFNAPGLADDAEGAVDARILLVTASLLPNPLPGMFTASQAQWPVVVLQGGVPDIQPQTASTWEIGAEIDPPFVPGLKLSGTYYRIDFEDIIGFPPAQRLLDLYTNYGDYYTMNPTAAQVLAAAAEVPGGVATVTPLLVPGALPIYNLLDSRRRNLGRVKVAGLDFLVSYRRATEFGGIDMSLAGTYELKRENQPVAGTPFIDTLAADINRLRWTGNLGIDFGRLRSQLTWYHRSGYKLTPTAANNFQTRAQPFDVLDLFFRYDLTGTSPMLRDAAITLTINNVFDTTPPLYRGTSQTTQGHGYVNGYTVGRMLQIGVSKKF